MENIVIRLDGRYALIERKGAIESFVVACGYDAKSGEWEQGYYYQDYEEASRQWWTMVALD
ncbi:MAG: hypothetical protein FWF56_03630 [Firmicutes bacterium]|nr:hypothetical protein [Bacillota bacterium]